MKKICLALALPIVVGLSACSEGPREIPIHLLTVEQDALSGAVIVTEGVVRTHDDPRHYWIEDDSLNRVAIEPDDLAEPYLGERVRVEGQFTADDVEGRRIEIRSISVIDDEPMRSEL